MKKLIIAATLAIMAASCMPNVKYHKESEISVKKGMPEWGAFEIKMTVIKMVNSLYDYLKNQYKKPVFLQVKKFSNRTSEHIDSSLVTDEITTELIKMKIRFIDDTLTGESEAEIARGKSGSVDQSTAVAEGQLKSPNLYLTGDIREAVASDNKKDLQYIVVTMKLYDIATGEILWQEHARFLKTRKRTAGLTF